MEKKVEEIINLFEKIRYDLKVLCNVNRRFEKY